MLIISNAHKPKNCYSCPFNYSDIYCGLDSEHITIDRDDYSPMDNKCPLAEIPDNATNGDIIKALFPNINFEEFYKAYVGYFQDKYGGGRVFEIDKEWWNAPYKKEGDGEC